MNGSWAQPGRPIPPRLTGGERLRPGPNWVRGGAYAACLALVVAAVPTGLRLARAAPPPTGDTRDALGTTSPQAVTEAPVAANPLWGVPLSSLTATRERPIFLPSR